MAKLYGFNQRRGSALNRVADREGLAPRTAGGRTRYLPPLLERGIWIGKADAAIASDNSVGVTVSIWTGSPPTDSGENLEDCFNWTGIAIDSGAKVKVTQINGVLYAEPWQCPA